MKKYILLKYDVSTVFFLKLKDQNLYNFYNPRWNKIMIKIFAKLNIDFLLFGNWKKLIKDLDTIILFDTGYKSSMAKYMKRKNKHCKIIFYYWNLIHSYNQFVLKDPNIDEIWTFDKEDALNYNLKWNPQFYTYQVKLKSSQFLYDVIFLGRDKGRECHICELKNSFEQLTLHTKFIVVKKESDFMDYNEYLTFIEKSRAILDIIAPGQTGLTLRAMEALFLEKKLITNNQDIKNYAFYKKENIFIIGEDHLDNLVEFVRTPYIKVPKKIVDYYDYESWLKRFFESK